MYILDGPNSRWRNLLAKYWFCDTTSNMVGNATVGKIRKLILDFLISCLADIVRGWGSGRGQGERLVNLGHNQPTQPSIYWNLSEVLDREVILAKTN